MQSIYAAKDEISGFGDEVLKIVDNNGHLVCYINKKLIHFPKSISIECLQQVCELMTKKDIPKKDLMSSWHG